MLFNEDNLEACRLIRRYLLSSVHQDTIVEEAADQARDHGHDVIATWLEVCRSLIGVQTCPSLKFSFCLQSSVGFTPLHFACDARDVEVCATGYSCGISEHIYF